MPIKTITIIICDAPKCLRVRGPVTADTDRHMAPNEEHIDAGVYGVVFHVGCWQNMSAPEAAKALGLDDIQYANSGERAWKAGK
jgi:hypothetical protein